MPNKPNNAFLHRRVFYLSGKNARSSTCTLYAKRQWVCLATIGAAFFMRSFGCAFFYFREVYFVLLA